MSKLYQTSIQSPQSLLNIVQKLKKHNIKSIKLKYIFQKKTQLETYQKLNDKNVSIHYFSNNQNLQKQPQIEQMEDDSSQEQQQTYIRNQLSYVYYFKDSRFSNVFPEIYQKQMKQLQEHHNCKLTIYNNGIKIELRSEDKTQRNIILSKFYQMQMNILQYPIKPKIRFGLKLSQLQRQKLQNQHIRLNKLENNKAYFWSKKSLINQDTFMNQVKRIQNSHRQIFRIINQRLMPQAQKNFIYYLIVKTLKKQIQNIQKVHELKLEHSQKYKSLILHVSSIEFIQYINQKLTESLKQKIVMSINFKFDNCIGLKMQNLIRKLMLKTECSRLNYKLQKNKLGICFARKLDNSIIKKLIECLMQDMNIMNTQFDVRLYFVHYVQKKKLFENFEVKGNLFIVDKKQYPQIILTPKLLGEEVVSDLIEIILHLKNYLLNPQQYIQSKLQKSQIQQQSKLLSTEFSKISIDTQIQQDYTCSYQYSPQFDSNLNQLYTIAKRDLKMAQFISQKTSFTYICRKLILSNKLQWIQLNNPDLYFTQQEFQQNNYLKKRLKLYTISTTNIKPKYLIQANTSKLQKITNSCYITPTQGTYRPTHEMIKL